jgi:hypothetical protein
MTEQFNHVSGSRDGREPAMKIATTLKDELATNGSIPCPFQYSLHTFASDCRNRVGLYIKGGRVQLVRIVIE